MSLISVVIPVYNEEACLEALFDRLSKIEKSSPDTYEFVFVDDGSSDGSKDIIKKLCERQENVKYIFFSRNFGHESATTAGLDHASGDAVVIIDSDLQDPPEVIPQLIEKWRQGHHIVYAQRRIRSGESPFKKFTSWLFYRFIRTLSAVDMPVDTGDFRLMDRSVVTHFRRCRERDRFVRGLVAWTGFKQVGVLYDRDERFAGDSKYSFFKLIVLSIDAVLGFSNLPLRIGSIFGLLICAMSFLMALIIVINKTFFGIPIKGYALIVTGIFFLGGVQLLLIGLVGEYIGRIYHQVKNRPLYIISEKDQALPPGQEGWAGYSSGNDTSK